MVSNMTRLQYRMHQGDLLHQPYKVVYPSNDKRMNISHMPQGFQD
jgi:hypothetical protein